MLAFAPEFLMQSAVMLPVIVLASAVAWAIFNKLEMLHLHEPFDAGDMRTWPLAYAITDAAIFALVFAAITSVLGDGQLAAAAGGGGAALIAIGAIPLLIAR